MRFGASIPVPLLIMDDKQNNIIGLADLVDEVHRDLDELRKKHPSDYSIRNITMWWELEKERLLARHGSTSVARKLRRHPNLVRVLVWFFAGWVAMLAVQTTIAFWMR